MLHTHMRIYIYIYKLKKIYIYIYIIYIECIYVYASSLVVTQHRLDHCLWPSNMQLNVCTVAVGKGQLNTILVTSNFVPRS